MKNRLEVNKCSMLSNEKATECKIAHFVSERTSMNSSPFFDLQKLLAFESAENRKQKKLKREKKEIC